MLYQQDSELENWASNITAINLKIYEVKTIDSQQTQIVNTLKADIEQANKTFYSTVNYLMNSPRNQTVRTDPTFQSNWSQLIISIQTASTSSAVLAGSIHNQSDMIQQSNVILIVLFLIFLSMYFLANYLITYRRTLKSIAQLQKGVKIVGSGNLEYILPVSNNDEISELSEAFNKMTFDLKNMTAKLQEHERMVAIGQTAGMVGHDLRNPLQTISGQVYLAKDELHAMPESELKSSLKESIQEIEEQISYMNKIVSDLQTFVRPVEFQKTEFNFYTFIVTLLTEIDVPSNVKTETKIDKTSIINTDKQLLKRVLTNLIINAIQAMPQGGQLEISEQISADKKRIKIIVADTGEGIPDDIKLKIFTPLFTTKSRGQGFGLAVCKRVIDALGGTISFESEVSKGTKFFVELPFEANDQI